MSVRLTGVSELRLWHYTGPASPALLAEAGLPALAAPLTAALHAEGFLARLGADDYLLGITGEQAPLPRRDSDSWRFARGDRVLRLSGAGWQALMTWVCNHDFRRLESSGWLMTSIAGVGGWCFREGPDALLIGCDPSYGDYLEHTLRTVVADHGATACNEE